MTCSGVLLQYRVAVHGGCKHNVYLQSLGCQGDNRAVKAGERGRKWVGRVLGRGVGGASGTSTAPTDASLARLSGGHSAEQRLPGAAALRGVGMGRAGCGGGHTVSLRIMATVRKIPPADGSAWGWGCICGERWMGGRPTAARDVSTSAGGSARLPSSMD